MKLNHQYYIGNKAIADIRWLAVIFIGQILVSNMLGKKPKYRNGQTLVNKKTGRQVIIIGDINIAYREIDHCDPQRAIREQNLKSFEDHPARKWFDGILAPNGPLIDLFRMFHPNEKGMYTCKFLSF